MLSRNPEGRDRHAGGAIKTITSVLVLARSFQDPSDNLYYIESPHLDIISAGKTEAEARAVFDEAIRLTLKDWTDDGVLEQRLMECGFVPHELAAAGYEVTMLTPQGVEVETQLHPPQALPLHYNIRPVPYSVNTGVACPV